MSEPSIKILDDDMVQLYSGREEDMIPFLSIGRHYDNIILQIPAGNSLAITEELAREFAGQIIELADNIRDWLKE